MSSRKTKLLSKIEGKTTVVDIIGLGHVGLSSVVEIAKAGYRTIGLNVQEQGAEQANCTHSYTGDVMDSALEDIVKNGRLSATSDFSLISSVDCATIYVPTPLDKYQQSDINYIKGPTESVARYLHVGMLATLESTTHPDTIEELLKPILEESGLVCGKDFFLTFPPERVDLGNKQYKTKSTSKVMGGMGKDSTEVVVTLYRNVLEGGVYEVAPPAVAKMEELFENTYRNINIDLANGMTIICNRMGINVWDVINATKTRPYDFRVFYPDPGLGGHYIPLNPFYLTWKTRRYSYHARLVETPGRINTVMPEYMVDRTVKMPNRNKTAMNGACVLILGVAYKNGIDNYRESPVLDVIDYLLEQGADAVFFDPYIPGYRHKGNVHKGLTILINDKSKNADIVITCTTHECFDYNRTQSLSKATFDTRNAMKDVAGRSSIGFLQCDLTKQIRERQPGQRSFLREKPK